MGGRSLGKPGLRQHFDSVICSDDVLRVKPDPELYLLTASTLRTTPGNTLVIEDSANGVAAAKDAGAFCIAVPNPMTRDLPRWRPNLARRPGHRNLQELTRET